MYQKYSISNDFPTRQGFHFGNDANSKEYKNNYQIRSKLSVIENMREFDILLFCHAKIQFCLAPEKLSIREGIELRLEELVYAVEEKDFCPSQTFRAVNDVLFDFLQAI